MFSSVQWLHNKGRVYLQLARSCSQELISPPQRSRYMTGIYTVQVHKAKPCPITVSPTFLSHEPAELFELPLDYSYMQHRTPTRRLSANSSKMDTDSKKQ